MGEMRGDCFFGADARGAGTVFCGSAMTNETTANLMSESAGLTPVMRQYFAAKEQYPDCLMFCRIGDFYELFYEDAILVSRELQLTLTARDREKKQPRPMCNGCYARGTRLRYASRWRTRSRRRRSCGGR